MKNIFKKTFSVLLVISLLSAFSVQTFAAVSNNYASAKCASYEMVDKYCTFTKWGTDKVTVQNKGNVVMWVYINGCFQKSLNPGKEYTYATYSNSARVQVYAQKKALGSQRIIVKTTSGYIYNN